MTFPPASAERMRALRMEAFYDGASTPSISVPVLDFFGLPHGRAAPFTSALAVAQEGRGFNAYYPLPFGRRLRLEVTNLGAAPVILFYEIDYALGPQPPDVGYLHVSFRRQNPTTPKNDFVIAEGLEGPGRFLGCVVGIRVFADGMGWYGEGEVKMYRDGDRALPTHCGTGLEDYVGTAWGMGRHCTPYGGVTVLEPDGENGGMPRFVGFYRWHVPDAIIFHRTIRVTIQQIGAVSIPRGPDQERLLIASQARYMTAGDGWKVDHSLYAGTPLYAFATAERSDDYCATAFVYCRHPQPVSRPPRSLLTSDLA